MRDIKIDDNPFQRQMWDRLANRDFSISVSDEASLSDIEEFLTVSVVRDIAQSILNDVFDNSEFMYRFAYEPDFQAQMFDIAFQNIQEVDAMNQWSNVLSRVRDNIANQFWIAVANKMRCIMKN